jgi:hypothetical protein
MSPFPRYFPYRDSQIFTISHTDPNDIHNDFGNYGTHQRDQTISWLINKLQKRRQTTVKTITQNRLFRFILIATFISTAAIVGFGQQNTGGGRLAGTWDATVTIRNCATGDAIRSFASIGTFNEGGTFIGSTSGLAQALRTPEHGIWRHIGSGVYLMRFKTFNFDAGGNAVGYQVVTHTLTLSKDANDYFSEGTVQFYMLDGTPTMQGCSDAVGTRFNFD